MCQERLWLLKHLKPFTLVSPEAPLEKWTACENHFSVKLHFPCVSWWFFTCHVCYIRHVYLYIHRKMTCFLSFTSFRWSNIMSFFQLWNIIEDFVIFCFCPYNGSQCDGNRSTRWHSVSSVCSEHSWIQPAAAFIILAAQMGSCSSCSDLTLCPSVTSVCVLMFCQTGASRHTSVFQSH